MVALGFQDVNVVVGPNPSSVRGTRDRGRIGRADRGDEVSKTLRVKG